MSESRGREKPDHVITNRARRLLIKRMALATAISPTTLLSGGSGAAGMARMESTPEKCPDVKIPMKDVAGKVAFVTGGSSGIGLGIARAFADAGMKIAIGYRTQKHLDGAMKYLEGAGDRVLAISVDVVDRSAMETAAAQVVRVFGKVHVLVNNAGVTQHTPISSTTYDDWDWLMAVNLDGVFNGVHAFLPRIQSHGEGGHIISTASILGLFTGARSAVYSASKYAVVGLMESLRAELSEMNIGVSAFCPGLVASDIQNAARNRPSDLADTKFKPDVEAQAKERALRSDPERAMDPLEAGRLVLRGMRNNDLYILTHAEYGEIMRARNEALVASIPIDSHPTEARLVMAQTALASSIYAIELDRKRCARRGGDRKSCS